MQHIISYKQIGKLAFPVIIAQSVVVINGMIDLAFIPLRYRGHPSYQTLAK
ncbi:hypothetical protein SPSIL_039100 [Sporomusa silvacetica DSM 10669]|uniref:Uncharacterized protein n=1 Tax=Sporomusa silvacetica DSM 10669 TaxID=1123289 RepID=A0ABZ3IPQ9_9FIRM|nr:hypothetical protein [Sporomusa silvacetica]OZC13815.1 hypothetical protein SPSIL_51430 [Sporomusa silvacetica DSM 10669]